MVRSVELGLNNRININFMFAVLRKFDSEYPDTRSTRSANRRTHRVQI